MERKLQNSTETYKRIFENAEGCATCVFLGRLKRRKDAKFFPINL